MADTGSTLRQMPGDGIRRIPPHELEKVDGIVDRYSGRPEFLIPALKDAQETFGYLPKEVQHRLADGFVVSRSHVYGVVTFYSFFTTIPRGKHTVRLCLGTACYVKGSRRILHGMVSGFGINVGETTADGKFTVEAVRCLGACGLAPAMIVDDDTLGNLAPADTMELLQAYDQADIGWEGRSWAESP